MSDASALLFLTGHKRLAESSQQDDRQQRRLHVHQLLVVVRVLNHVPELHGRVPAVWILGLEPGNHHVTPSWIVPSFVGKQVGWQPAPPTTSLLGSCGSRPWPVSSTASAAMRAAISAGNPSDMATPTSRTTDYPLVAPCQRDVEEMEHRHERLKCFRLREPMMSTTTSTATTISENSTSRKEVIAVHDSKHCAEPVKRWNLYARFAFAVSSRLATLERSLNKWNEVWCIVFEKPCAHEVNTLDGPSHHNSDCEK